MASLIFRIRNNCAAIFGLCLLPLFSCNTGVSKQPDGFSVQTLDGAGYESVISRFDTINGNYILRIDDSDSICVSGVLNIDTTQVTCGDRFLLLKLKLRGGSGVKVHRLLQLAVRNRKLLVVSDFFSTASYYLAPQADSINQMEIDSVGLLFCRLDTQVWSHFNYSGVDKIGRWDSDVAIEHRLYFDGSSFFDQQVFSEDSIEMVLRKIVDPERLPDKVEKISVINFGQVTYFNIHYDWYYKLSQDDSIYIIDRYCKQYVASE